MTPLLNKYTFKLSNPVIVQIPENPPHVNAKRQPLGSQILSFNGLGNRNGIKRCTFSCSRDYLGILL